MKTENEIRNAVITALDAFQEWERAAKESGEGDYWVGYYRGARDAMADTRRYLDGLQNTIHND